MNEIDWEKYYRGTWDNHKYPNGNKDLLNVQDITRFFTEDWDKISKEALSRMLSHDDLVELCWLLGKDRQELKKELRNILDKNVIPMFRRYD
jgi:hypothetical protein